MTSIPAMIVAKLRFGDAAFKVRLITLPDDVQPVDVADLLEQTPTDFGKWEADQGILRSGGRIVGRWLTTVTNPPEHPRPASPDDRTVEAEMMDIVPGALQYNFRGVRFPNVST